MVYMKTQVRLSLTKCKLSLSSKIMILKFLSNVISLKKKYKYINIPKPNYGRFGPTSKDTEGGAKTSVESTW